MRFCWSTLNRFQMTTHPLYRIVYAEERTYFYGEKTLDEVLNVIQSRAMLCLQEK